MEYGDKNGPLIEFAELEKVLEDFDPKFKLGDRMMFLDQIKSMKVNNKYISLKDLSHQIKSDIDMMPR